jgi:hypothetical protein
VEGECIVITLTGNSVVGRTSAGTAASPRCTPTAGDAELDPATIADLPAAILEHMSRAELVGIIRAVDLGMISRRIVGRLPNLDRATLLRLAHLAARCCRNMRTLKDA